MPANAPTFFFVDIQRDQIEPFTATVTGTEGVDGLETVPSLRGRIIAANGIPARQALTDPEYGWLLRGDRGVTFRAEPRPEDRVVAGQWWADDYSGPPLVSIYQDIGLALGSASVIA